MTKREFAGQVLEGVGHAMNFIADASRPPSWALLRWSLWPFA